MEFEEMFEKLQPMITAHMRKLNIYKNFEQFRQVANIAIWLAWERYDPQKGDFEPYASKSIRGALLDELKKSIQYEELQIPTEDSQLQMYLDSMEDERNINILEQLTEEINGIEKKILRAYYFEGNTHKEIANELNMSTAALQKKKSRLLKRLRKVLNKNKFM